jgi:tetratricopeptide (TPR) repeat protein
MGGVVAFAVFGLVVAGYMTSRKMGVGPGASLVSAGVLEDQAEVLIADFENRTGDEMLGEALREALSVDLSQSTAIKVVSQDRVARVLVMMEKEPDTRVDLDVAREIAIRHGAAAVVAGQVVPTGSSFVLSVRLIGAESGDVLTAHRESARGDSELIDAVDRLSHKLREKIGESLRNIRGEKSLAQVTTGSLEALRKYTAALQAINVDEDEMRGIELLKEATAQDSTFAMAYRKLAVVLNNNGLEAALALDATTRAYELRENLTPRESYLAAAFYHSYLNETEKTITAYENLLDLDPDDIWALNNLCVMYRGLQNYEKALEYIRRAASVEETASHYSNEIACLIGLSRFEEAEAVYRDYREFSDTPGSIVTGAWYAFAQRNYDLVESRLDEAADLVRGDPLQTRYLEYIRVGTMIVQGRLKEAETQIAFGREAMHQLEDRAGLLGTLLWFAWVDIMLRERTDRVEDIISGALEQVPPESLDPLDRPYLELSDLYALIGKTDRSREFLERYRIEVDPRIQKAEEASHHFSLGTIALAEGRHRAAIDEYQAAKRKGNWPFNTLLGRAYDAAGEPDSALAAYEQYVNTPRQWLLSVDPTNLAPSLYRIAELYEERGDFDMAVRYYSKFTELWENADADLQPRVKAAQTRVNVLMAEKPKS